MKKIKGYNEYINEKYVSVDDIHAKYYSNIDKVIFAKIISADPTSTENKMGIYSKWLLKLFVNKNLKIEDLYKATEYLEAFHKFKSKLPITDINKINTLPELFKNVEPFLHKEDAEFSNEDERELIGQYKQVFKNSKYRIIVPYTLKASKYFAQDTEWCTRFPDQFKSYTKYQTEKIDANALYILYTEDPEERLQFHFESRQFMDVSDSYVEPKDFFEENEDIKIFFNSYFRLDIYIEMPDYVISELSSKYNLNIIFIEDDFNEWVEENKDWKKQYDVVITYINYDEHPMDGSLVFTFNYYISKKANNKSFQNMVNDIYENCRMTITYDEDGYYDMYVNL